MTIEEIIAYLKMEGMAIGLRAREGDSTALKCMQAYQFFYNCPGDQMGQVLLEDAIKEYIQKQKETVN